jgi:hypothetical protein
MSWTQGVQDAETLTDKEREFFQSKVPPEAKFTCLVWDTTEPELLHADYYTDGVYACSRTFRVKK